MHPRPFKQTGDRPDHRPAGAGGFTQFVQIPAETEAQAKDFTHFGAG